MEYLVIDKATGKQIGNGFTKKGEAKSKRNELQAKTKEGMPKEEVKHDQTLWAFKVTKGPNHPKNRSTIH